jgi:hypothetical protein
LNPSIANATTNQPPSESHAAQVVDHAARLWIKHLVHLSTYNMEVEGVKNNVMGNE